MRRAVNPMPNRTAEPYTGPTGEEKQRKDASAHLLTEQGAASEAASPPNAHDFRDDAAMLARLDATRRAALRWLERDGRERRR